MKYNVIYNQEYNCLIGKYVGDLNIESVKKYAKEISKMARIHDCKRFINDLREATILLSVANFYDAPSIVSIDEFDRTWKRAIITNQNFDKLNFFETTSINQGFDVKIFQDINEALEWL